MKSNTSFQELAKLQTEELSKQPILTLEEARAQVQQIKEQIAARKDEHSFEELAKLQEKQLSKQHTLTLEQKREQAKRVLEARSKNKKT